MPSTTNLLVQTADRPYIPITALSGVSFKPMNTLAEPRVWSAVIRVEAGHCLPAHYNTALCEYFIIAGSGSYASGGGFSSGDYLQEHKGDYEAINAVDELVVFMTHHGDCSFFVGGSCAFVAGVDSIRELQGHLASETPPWSDHPDRTLTHFR